MPDHSVEFASLLCSRLCHDMMSPVGALMNAVELLVDEQDPAMREQCMSLLSDGARMSADKLKFFRLAFGAAGGLGEEVSADDVRVALDGLVRANSRLELVWMIEQSTLSKAITKILLNLGMIAVEALVRGGRLVVAVESGEVVVRAEAARIVLDREVRAVLCGEQDDISARTSVAWLARRIAEQRGLRLRLAEEEGVMLLAAIAA
jgi:histidine phosphotransferase ChpT